MMYDSLGLDLYQYHYYDYMEDTRPLDYPAADLGLDKPVILGEIESTNVTAKLQLLEDNGYKGVLFWSLNAGYGSDSQSVAGEFKNYFEP